MTLACAALGGDNHTREIKPGKMLHLDAPATKTLNNINKLTQPAHSPVGTTLARRSVTRKAGGYAPQNLRMLCTQPPAYAAPGGDNDNRRATPKAGEGASLALYHGVAQTDNATA